VKRLLDGGYELDDDPARIDIDAVHAYLSTQYWARGRSRRVVHATVATAARVVGLYHQQRQVGFARVMSDYQTTCMLFDVYVLEPHRGRGLGVELVREAVDADATLAPLKWVLHTRDMHRLYERFGFHAASGRVMERN
jgi:GNAT superfamily N-acetyltransferase